MLLRRAARRHYRSTKINGGLDDGTAKADAWLTDFNIVRDIPAGDFNKNLQTFEGWLLSKNARFGNVELRNSGTGEGCAAYARSSIPAGTPVISVPVECLVTASSARETVLGDIAASTGINENNGNLFLTLSLLELWSNPAHKSFKPYLGILPRRMPWMPLFWSSSDLELLAGSPLQEEIGRRREALLKDFAGLQERAASWPQPPGSKSGAAVVSAASLLRAATPADFATAELTVCSRLLGLFFVHFDLSLSITFLFTKCLFNFSLFFHFFRKSQGFPCPSCWSRRAIRALFGATRGHAQHRVAAHV